MNVTLYKALRRESDTQSLLWKMYTINVWDSFVVFVTISIL